MCKHRQSQERMHTGPLESVENMIPLGEEQESGARRCLHICWSLWMNDLRESRWSGGKKAAHGLRSSTHPCTPSSMCLIFISAPQWVSAYFTFHFSNTDTPPPWPTLLPLPRLSPAAPASLRGCRMQIRSERPLEQNGAFLSALHAHRRWLHTLRCDNESQMLCRSHDVTHTQTLQERPKVNNNIWNAKGPGIECIKTTLKTPSRLNNREKLS